MNAIDKYQQAKQALRDFERWKSLIGKEYYGGTCGRGGKFGYVISASFQCEIYHQESDGSANYHESAKLSDVVRSALNEAAKKHACAIISTAHDLILNRLAQDASAVNKLADEIAKDAKGVIS